MPSVSPRNLNGNKEQQHNPFELLGDEAKWKPLSDEFAVLADEAMHKLSHEKARIFKGTGVGAFDTASNEAITRYLVWRFIGGLFPDELGYPACGRCP